MAPEAQKSLHLAACPSYNFRSKRSNFPFLLSRAGPATFAKLLRESSSAGRFFLVRVSRPRFFLREWPRAWRRARAASCAYAPPRSRVRETECSELAPARRSARAARGLLGAPLARPSRQLSRNFSLSREPGNFRKNFRESCMRGNGSSTARARARTCARKSGGPDGNWS